MGFASGAAPPAPIPWVGERGITQTVAQIMARAALLPKSNGPSPIVIYADERAEPDRSRLPQDPRAPAVSQWPAPPGPRVTDADTAAHPAPRSPRTVGVSFKGPRYAETAGIVPPDSSGDVGPSQILMCTNGRIRVYARDGTPGPLDTTLDSFFDAVRNGSATSDPRIRYDHHAQRWFVICINIIHNSNRCLIAASSGPAITAASSFTFYYFQQDLVAPAGDPGGFLDYPTLGVDANALYIGGNMFGGPSLTQSAWVVRKSSLLTGGPIVATAARNIGIYTPQGATNYDTSIVDGYFVGTANSGRSQVLFMKVTSPGGVPVFAPPVTVVVPTTASSATVKAMGTTGGLDAFDDRLFMATISKNRLTGQVSLWTAQHFRVNASGVASDSGNRLGSRWYQFASLDTTPALAQAGTLFDPTSTARSYFYPSVVMTGQGHMVIASSTACAAEFAQIYTAGRLDSDALGTTRPATLVQASTTPYNIEGAGAQRWGDYSYTALDPTDDMTAWTFQEYCDAANSWAVRCIQLKAPPPAPLVSCAPASLPQGAGTVDLAVTGAALSGAGFFDSPAATSHLAAAFDGAGLAVNSVSFVDPTHITVNVAIGPAADPGPRVLSVTNPDGQSTAAAVFTVTPACPADINQDGVVDFGDYLVFLNVFDAMDPAADLNGDGVVDFGDYLEFLNHYDAGC